MANTRIKDLSTITPVDATFVPGDSVGTGTGKATIGAWVLAGIKSALAAVTGAVAAAGTWTFSSPVAVSELTCSGDIAADGAIFAGNGMSAGGRIDAVTDPVSAQQGSTKAYTDAGDAAGIAAIAASDCAAAFSSAGVKQFSTSALFTGNATVSDTSLFTIPFAGAAGSFCPVAIPLTGNPNFATVTLTGAPTSFDVRVWKYDGTKEARDFIVIVRRGAA